MLCLILVPYMGDMGEGGTWGQGDNMGAKGDNMGQGDLGGQGGQGGGEETWGRGDRGHLAQAACHQVLSLEGLRTMSSWPFRTQNKRVMNLTHTLSPRRGVF